MFLLSLIGEQQYLQTYHFTLDILCKFKQKFLWNANAVLKPQFLIIGFHCFQSLVVSLALVGASGTTTHSGS